MKKQEQTKKKKVTVKSKKTAVKETKKRSTKTKKEKEVKPLKQEVQPITHDPNPLIDTLITFGACFIGLFIFVVVFGPFGPSPQIEGVHSVSTQKESKIEVEFYDLAKSTFRGTELEKLGWRLTKEDERNVALEKGDLRVIVGLDSYVAGLQQYRLNIPQRDIEEILDFQAHLSYFTREQ